MYEKILCIWQIMIFNTMHQPGVCWFAGFVLVLLSGCDDSLKCGRRGLTGRSTWMLEISSIHDEQNGTVQKDKVGANDFFTWDNCVHFFHVERRISAECIVRTKGSRLANDVLLKSSGKTTRRTLTGIKSPESSV